MFHLYASLLVMWKSHAVEILWTVVTLSFSLLVFLFFYCTLFYHFSSSLIKFLSYLSFSLLFRYILSTARIFPLISCHRKTGENFPSLVCLSCSKYFQPISMFHRVLATDRFWGTIVQVLEAPWMFRSWKQLSLRASDKDWSLHGQAILKK